MASGIPIGDGEGLCENSAEFTVAHERLATNKRDLHRLVPLDKGDNPLDERITA